MSHSIKGYRFYRDLTQIMFVLLCSSLIFARLNQVIGGELANARWPEAAGLLGLSLLSPTYWIGQIPAICYITAVWSAAGFFDALNKGQAFSPAVIKALNSIGSNLSAGAVFAMIVVPNLLAWIDGAHGGFKYSLTTESMTFSVIGMVLMVIAATGAKVHAELDSIV
jgi:hypothetical protein